MFSRFLQNGTVDESVVGAPPSQAKQRLAAKQRDGDGVDLSDPFFSLTRQSKLYYSVLKKQKN